MFYLYILLDPRREGNYVYNDLKLNYEPYYVGKGKGGRYKEHVQSLGVNEYNPKKINKIKKLISLGYDPLNYVEIIPIESEELAYEKEIELISLIGRNILKEGPLTNILKGGKGGGDTISYHPNKIEIIKNVKRFSRKNKTYKELYGERAEEEKEKRIKNKGIKRDRSIVDKAIATKKLKPQKAWNKGISKNQYIVSDYINSFERVCNGEKELHSFVAEYNKENQFPKLQRINVGKLRKNKIDKQLILKIKSND